MVLPLVGPEGPNSSAEGARTLSAISFQFRVPAGKSSIAFLAGG